MSFYIFVNSDGYDLNDKKVCSKQIALYRITNKTYPLYKNTRNANSIKKDDFFIFYQQEVLQLTQKNLLHMEEWSQFLQIKTILNMMCIYLNLLKKQLN